MDGDPIFFALAQRAFASFGMPSMIHTMHSPMSISMSMGPSSPFAPMSPTRSSYHPPHHHESPPRTVTSLFGPSSSSSPSSQQASRRITRTSSMARPNSLHRDGIMPAMTSGRSTSTALVAISPSSSSSSPNRGTKGAARRRTVPRAASHDHDTSTAAPTNNGDRRLGNGWMRRGLGTGRFLRRAASAEIVMEGTSIAPFIASWEDHNHIGITNNGHDWQLDLQAKCVGQLSVYINYGSGSIPKDSTGNGNTNHDSKENDAKAPTSPTGSGGNGSYIAVIMDTARRVWDVALINRNRITTIGTANDSQLTATSYVSICMQVYANRTLTLTVDGHVFFDHLAIPSSIGTRIGSWPALAVTRSKAVVKNIMVRALTTPHASMPSPNASHGSPIASPTTSPNGTNGTSAFARAKTAAAAAAAISSSSSSQQSRYHRVEQYAGTVPSSLIQAKLNAAANPLPGRPNLTSTAGTSGGSVPRPLYNGDDRALVQMIESSVIDRNLGVTFDDIASLTTAKQLLKEAVILPLLLPSFFQGIREPWKGVLLHGPPGTGKTMLARAVAGAAETTFFNMSPSTLTSKWRGESEKLVTTLFAMARYYAPSIIFFDEIDSLVGARGNDSEHEASRRFKSVLFSEMDGINSTVSPPPPSPTVAADGTTNASNVATPAVAATTTAAMDESNVRKNMVMVLATSNHPWDLDMAMRRRLEKRIYIPLPDATAREQMLAILLKGIKLDSSVSFAKLATLTMGFSGADLKLLCRDAAMLPMRRIVADLTPAQIKALQTPSTPSPSSPSAPATSATTTSPSSSSSSSSTPSTAVPSSNPLDFVVTMSEFEDALKRINPSVDSKEIAKFEEWQKEFGSL